MQIIPYTQETLDMIHDKTKDYIERYNFFRNLELMHESEFYKKEREKSKAWYEKNKEFLEKARDLRNKEIKLIKEKKEFIDFKNKIENNPNKVIYISWDFFLCEDTEGTSHIPPLEDLTMTFGSDEYNKKYKELLNKING